MSFNDQQSNEGGWQTVRSRTGGQERPAFGQRQSGGGQERPVFGQRQSGGGQERPVFGQRQSGDGRADAPAAFGGGNSNRREQEEARAAFRAAEAREKKKAEEAIAVKQAEAENFASESSYPSLGSSTASATKPAPSSTLNFKQAVKDMIAKEAEAQLAAAAAAEEAAYANATAIREPSRQPFSRRRILDELEDDYSGPEEDEEDDEEVNADIGSGRRRGDKGIW